MVEGCVVLCGTLGFCRILSTFGTEVVLKKCEAIDELVRWAVASVRSGGEAFWSESAVRAEARIFSDTVLFAAWSENNDLSRQQRLANLLDLACRFSISLTDQGCQHEPTFVYRGCISVGEVAVTKSVIVGPALVDAARLMDAPDGAFVWLAPGAAAVVTSELAGFRPDDAASVPYYRGFLNKALIHYDVPLKDGRTVPAYVVNPFGNVIAGGGLITKRILSSFTDELDVRVKRSNTKRFLERAVATVDAESPKSTE